MVLLPLNDTVSANDTVTIKRLPAGKDRIPVLAVYRDATSAGPLVVVVHGFTGRKEVVLSLAYDLAAQGYLAVALDVFGHGERKYADFEGRFATDFPQEFFCAVDRTARDVSMVIDHFCALGKTRKGDVGIVGVSMGGFIALASAYLDRRIQVCASVLATPVWSDFLEQFWVRGIPELEISPTSRDEALAERIASKQPFSWISHYQPRALLLVSAGKDPFIPQQGFRDFVNLAHPIYQDIPGARLELAEFPNFGHQFIDAMVQRVVDFFAQHLDHTQRPA